MNRRGFFRALAAVTGAAAGAVLTVPRLKAAPPPEVVSPIYGINWSQPSWSQPYGIDYWVIKKHPIDQLIHDTLRERAEARYAELARTLHCIGGRSPR